MNTNLFNNKRPTLKEYRKEGHLYLVTEDRHNHIFLFDITDKPKYEIEETDFPEDLLSEATEGSVFIYENNTYTLYSKNGYDMLNE